MQTSSGMGLARVTVASQHRRLDLALPEQVPLAEILPTLLRYAGEELADAGEQHGGWVLRRTDGTTLETARSLAAHAVRDGEVLHLQPRRAEWPEMDVDDVVHAIAEGARSHGVAWNGTATRICALSVAGVFGLVGLFTVLTHGRDWLVAGLFSLGIGFFLALMGVVLSRALSDSHAGAALAGFGLPFAFTGGLVLLLPANSPLAGVGAANLLLGSAALLVTAVVSFLGVADQLRLFVAGMTAGFLGVLAGLLGFALSAPGVAAIVLTLLVCTVSAIPLIAIRLGKLPVPALPRDPDELVEVADPSPDRDLVNAAVVRTDELLTGMLFGACSVSGVAAVLLIRTGGVAAPLLVAVASLAFLLRARLFVTVRQRLPLLTVGVVGLAALAVGGLGLLPASARLLAALGTLVVLGGLVVASGLIYARRPPSPYVSRAGEILDVLMVIAVVPIACAVVDLYAWIRALSG